MFTGLVEAVGTVAKMQSLGEQARVEIVMPFASDLTLGDSVAVNGCCLTAVEVIENKVSFDVLKQTLSVTALGELKEGSSVNLERALRAGDHLGGHFMQGHVDAIGTVSDLSPHGQDHRLEIQLPEEVHRYCIDKGSLAIDGISLTIAELTPSSAIFWIIPHTLEQTHLHTKTKGSKVNLEADLLAKYTEKLLQSRLK